MTAAIRNLLVVAAVAAVAAAGVAAGAAPASAGCYGTANVAVLCASVSPFGATLYEDCVYTGSEPCTPVSVRGPKVTECGGSVLGEPLQMHCG